jgi:flavin reductase (DIM6/NTAB) family NADH-FMN oxidoreductase RutF
MRAFRKKDFPAEEARWFLEPGPIVLVSSAWKGERNIMTLGWHMILGFAPSLVGCYIWDANHSFELIRRSRQCVINLPTLELAAKVVGIGNCSGREVDKFARFKLTAAPAA